MSGNRLAALRMVSIGLLIMLTMMYRSKGLVPEKRKMYKVE
jgi:ABC-type branched-subunit amino acid transport system permease subunit